MQLFGTNNWHYYRFDISNVRSVRFLKPDNWIINNLSVFDVTINDGRQGSSDIFTKHEDFMCFEEKVTEDYVIVPQTCINKKFVWSVRYTANGFYKIELGSTAYYDKGDGKPSSFMADCSVIVAVKERELFDINMNKHN